VLDDFNLLARLTPDDLQYTPLVQLTIGDNNKVAGCSKTIKGQLKMLFILWPDPLIQSTSILTK
jgi:hypothetical protein